MFVTTMGSNKSKKNFRELAYCKDCTGTCLKNISVFLQSCFIHTAANAKSNRRPLNSYNLHVATMLSCMCMASSHVHACRDTVMNKRACQLSYIRISEHRAERAVFIKMSEK